MKKIEISPFKVKIIIMVLLTVMVAVAIPTTIKIIDNINAGKPDNDNNNDDSSSNNSSQDSSPVLSVPQSITLDKFDSSFKFEYTVYNLGSYQVSVTIQDPAIASLNTQNYIIPSAVGSTNIITTINCEPQITKTTTLTITDAVTDISYTFTNLDSSQPSALFVGNTYYLNITENALIADMPNLTYMDEYVGNVEFVSKTDQVCTYSFKIKQAGSFNFYYNGKYCQKYIAVTSYNMPTDIDISFSNIVLNENCANLYLFNDNYTTEANNDGYFSTCTFNINIASCTYDIVNVDISGDSITISNNQITAVKTGTSYVTFYSSISKISKTFTFNVANVAPTHVVLNDTEYNIESSIDLAYGLNVENDFNISVKPIYALGEIAVQADDGISIDNNKAILTNSAGGKIYVLFDNQIILTCNVSALPEYQLNVSLGSHTCEANLNNNILQIVLGDENYLLLTFSVIDTVSKQIINNPTINFSISDTSIINSSSDTSQIKNGQLILTVLSTGTTTITFENSVYGINYELTIAVE